MKYRINSFELCLYFSMWILANFYSLYKLFQAQSGILNKNQTLQHSLEDLHPGWEFTSRLKDVSDIEWSTWRHFIHTAWLYLFLQFIVSEIVRRSANTYLKHWYFTSSIIFVTLNFGYRQLILILIQPLLYATIIFCGGKKICIWLASMILLMSYNTIKYKTFLWTFLDRENMYDEEVYSIIFCLPWVELRCISFCINYVDINNCATKRSKLESMINMLSYVLYAPILYTGPVILYQDFEKSFSSENKKLLSRFGRFFWDNCIFLLYTFILELALHFIYFYAMQEDIELIKLLPTLALCGGGLYMGLQFHMKYVIAYGTTTAFARLDNLDPPPTPRCIARIHVYSEMWRYFDVGLYRFLIKYIYKPVCESLSEYFKWPKFAYKLTALLIIYSFVFLWHGMIERIFIWSLFNYIGITLEHLGKMASETEYYKWFRAKVLKTDEMETRFIAMLCVPLLALSAISNFYLFANTDVGGLYLTNALHPTLKNSLLICAALYSCCQCSMALKDVPSRTAHKKSKTLLKSID